jgi:hypothetical protein
MPLKTCFIKLESRDGRLKTQVIFQELFPKFGSLDLQVDDEIRFFVEEMYKRKRYRFHFYTDYNFDIKTDVGTFYDCVVECFGEKTAGISFDRLGFR